jgi:chromosome segregation ATPase
MTDFKIIDSQASITELDSIIQKTDDLAVAWKDRLLPAVKSVTSEMAKGTPKEYSEALKKAVEASKTLADTQKKLADAQSRLEQIEKNIIKTRQTGNTETEKARVKEIQLQQAREKAVDRFNDLEKKEQQRIANAASLYSKLEQKLKSLQLEYRDLAARKEIGIRLTEEESKRYDFLKSKIDKYDTTLKAVDASMGKHWRKVGEYERANNGLGMSLAQITREMPAFANSVSTGFMALSNNIPIFFDAIGQVKNLNKELQAQGKPTVSVLKQLAGALFSWQTLLSVGVTLLTIYFCSI